MDIEVIISKTENNYLNIQGSIPSLSSHYYGLKLGLRIDAVYTVAGMKQSATSKAVNTESL